MTLLKGRDEHTEKPHGKESRTVAKSGRAFPSRETQRPVVFVARNPAHGRLDRRVFLFLRLEKTQQPASPTFPTTRDEQSSEAVKPKSIENGAGLHFSRRALRFVPVSFFTRIIAFVLLAVWLPLTGVCVAKCATAADDDMCCPKSADHGAPGSPSGSNGNCIFASALAKIGDDHRTVFDASLVAIFFTELFFLPPVESSHCIASSGPPESGCIGWQFVTRCALPPRAPSFVS